jgi:hypothetical protein
MEGKQKTDLTDTSKVCGCILDSVVKQRVLVNTLMNLRIRQNASTCFEQVSCCQILEKHSTAGTFLISYLSNCLLKLALR